MSSCEEEMPPIEGQALDAVDEKQSLFSTDTAKPEDSYTEQYNGTDSRHIGTNGAVQRRHHTLRTTKSTKEPIPKNDSIVAAICQWTVEHQIGLAVNLLLLHGMTHVCFPRARQRTRKFHQLSHYNLSSGKYAVGWDDLYMVLYWIVVLTGLRAAIMDYLLVPLAQMAGVTKKKDKIRFSEQAWILIYDTSVWALGMYIMYTHEHWLSFREMWTGWPDRELDGSMKWYYLVQFAFWLQQILVVNIEERRKDHWQMFTHHVITCILMFTSYGYHQTKVGNTILCLMDVVDLFLALAKILKYLKFQLACDIAFGVFMLVWLAARHVLFLMVVYSLYCDIPTGCYSGNTSNLKGPFEPPDRFYHLIDPFLDPEGVVCWTSNVKLAFIWSLLALQVVLCIWFGMIMKVAAKVLRGGEAEDSRSDGEEGYEDAEPEAGALDDKKHYCDEAIELPPLEEEVGVEAINLGGQRNGPARIFRKGGGAASGVTLHSDRKELLGRIGCDKGA